MRLSLNYELLKSWKAVVLTSAGVVLTYLVLVYFHPENLGWTASDNFSWSNLLLFVLVDQILIECVTVAIIFFLLSIWARYFSPDEIHLRPKEVLRYELIFLPLLLLAFFVFAPFTLTIRFLYHALPHPDWSTYFESYFYSTELYLVYLFPSLLFGYGILNANLIFQYNQQLDATQTDLTKERTRRKRERLWAADDFGEVFLAIDQIRWVVREERRTFAITASERYRLKDSISQLEEKLDSEQFVRVNRSTIVNVDFVQNYSFWENDKYVLRMNDEKQTEFVMSRDRLNKVKQKLLEVSRRN